MGIQFLTKELVIDSQPLFRSHRTCSTYETNISAWEETDTVDAPIDTVVETPFPRQIQHMYIGTAESRLAKKNRHISEYNLDRTMARTLWEHMRVFQYRLTHMSITLTNRYQRTFDLMTCRQSTMELEDGLKFPMILGLLRMLVSNDFIFISSLCIWR